MEICNVKKCTGCGICATVCPKGCINMTSRQTELGHLYPSVDLNNCIKCNICKKKCPANNKIIYNTPINVYAGYSKDKYIHKTSTSGGLAYTIAKLFIDNGGIVYAAALECGEYIQLKHHRFTDIDTLEKIKGSKYIQSYIDKNIYNSLINDVLSKNKVLFIGTPCQVEGVKALIKQEYNQFLYTIDLVCHGVPSVKLFNNYIENECDLNTIKNISFRDETGFSLKLELKNEFKIFPLQQSAYYIGFIKGLLYRESCYQCNYAQKMRISDITLGDFWGIKNFSTDESNLGISLILINTNNGKKIFNQIKNFLYYEERTLNEAINKNKQLKYPSKKHYNYNKLKNLYANNNGQINLNKYIFFDKIIYKYIIPLIEKIL